MGYITLYFGKKDQDVEDNIKKLPERKRSKILMRGIRREIMVELPEFMVRRKKELEDELKEIYKFEKELEESKGKRELDEKEKQKTQEELLEKYYGEIFKPKFEAADKDMAPETSHYLKGYLSGSAGKEILKELDMDVNEILEYSLEKYGNGE